MGQVIGNHRLRPGELSGHGKQRKEDDRAFHDHQLLPAGVRFRNEDKRYIYSHKLILVSGIASDTPLRRYLSDSYDIVKHFKFNDHHKYTALDISRITGATNKWPTALIATTEKDSQRLRNYKKNA